MEIHNNGITAKQETYKIQQQNRISMRQANFIHQDMM